MSHKPQKVEEAIELLESTGDFIVKRRPKNYTKKTVEFNLEVWERADALRRQLNITVRDLLSEALSLWIDKRSSR